MWRFSFIPFTSAFYWDAFRGKGATQSGQKWITSVSQLSFPSDQTQIDPDRHMWQSVKNRRSTFVSSPNSSSCTKKGSKGQRVRPSHCSASLPDFHQCFSNLHAPVPYLYTLTRTHTHVYISSKTLSNLWFLVLPIPPCIKNMPVYLVISTVIGFSHRLFSSFLWTLTLSRVRYRLKSLAAALVNFYKNYLKVRTLTIVVDIVWSHEEGTFLPLMWLWSYSLKITTQHYFIMGYFTKFLNQFIKIGHRIS